MSAPRMERRDFLKAVVFGAGAVAGGSLLRGPAEALAAPESLLPREWPQTTEAAALAWGGKREYWRRDLYKSGDKVKWDGAWVMEAFPLTTGYKTDGAYIGTDGNPMPENEIYNFGTREDLVGIELGQHGTNFRAFVTGWNSTWTPEGLSGVYNTDVTGLYLAGYGNCRMTVEQAVVRPVDSDRNQEERAQREASITFGYFLRDDQAIKDMGSINAAFWNQKTGNWEVFQQIGQVAGNI